MWSPAQRRVIESTTLVGVDARRRPVVEGPVGIPQRTMRWAVTKAGDPVDVTDPVVPVERVSGVVVHEGMGGTLSPRTETSWRITVMFVDDPSTYSQELVGPTTVKQAMDHVPVTVRACNYGMEHLARVTITKL